MTCAFVTQLLNALEYHQSQTRPIHNTELAIEAAREYLAIEPIGERAELIARQRGVQENGINAEMRELAKATADMLESDATELTRLRDLARDAANAATQLQKQVLAHKAQQAKRVPMTEPEDLYALALKADNWGQP